MTQVGCTTPYRPDKSNICTDPEKSKQANDIYKKVKYNQTFATSVCPRSCMYQIIGLSRYEIGEGQPMSHTNLKADKRKTLTLTFQKFIKISKSRRSYTFLELIAKMTCRPWYVNEFPPFISFCPLIIMEWYMMIHS